MSDKGHNQEGFVDRCAAYAAVEKIQYAVQSPVCGLPRSAVGIAALFWGLQAPGSKTS